MRIISIIMIAAMICSCNNPLNKKIFDTLTVEELKASIDKDSTFEEAYSTIQHIKDSVLKTDLEKAKFADLTYDRVYKLLKYSQDTTYFKPIREELKKKWQDKYGVLHQKVDSISNYWKKYRDENSLGQYAKIELSEINKEYYSYSYGIRNVHLGFRLTPLKGKIDQLRFSYRIEAKINEKDEESLYESIYSSLDKSWCLATTPFSIPIVRYWEANYTNEKILESKNVETFNRDYNIYIEIDQIRKDGQNMSSDDLSIPKSVRNHWQYENKEHLSDLYVNDVLKDLLNIDYIPDYTYISDGIDKKCKDKDALAFDFLTATSKIK